MRDKVDYKTIYSEAQAVFEEKKSKFIAYIKPICKEAEAIEFINVIKTKRWDATHNVYAYIVKEDTISQRYSDDGEPSGTAGLPVLEVIKRSDLINVVMVVTRYFGGTLLGAAGLIRAYGKAASYGINASRVVWRRVCQEIAIVMEYALYGKMNSIIKLSKAYIRDVSYESDVEMLVCVEIGYVQHFIKKIIEESNDRVLIDEKECVYITVDEDGNIL
jgi:uncharacterized YigZ family protein